MTINISKVLFRQALANASQGCFVLALVDLGFPFHVPFSFPFDSPLLGDHIPILPLYEVLPARLVCSALQVCVVTTERVVKG